MEEKLIRLEGSPGCFICDNNGSNPRALGLKLYWDEVKQEVEIPFEPDQTWCGFEDVVHGGLAASVMDEGMAWVVKMATGSWAFTADYRICYKKTVLPGQKYLVRAKVSENKGRTIIAQSLLLDADGKTVAQSEATLIPAKGQARTRTAENGGPA